MLFSNIFSSSSGLLHIDTMSLKKDPGLRINDQIILEEDFDENYQPTEEGQWVIDVLEALHM